MRKRRVINKNSIPFLILTFFHVGILLITIRKRCTKKNWVILLLSNIGFAYIFEYFILNLFSGYSYRPSVMKVRYLDNIFGAILSQGLFVPITSTVLTIYKKNWKWKIGSSFSYYLIELIFIRLKIYKINWWKPVYTLFLMNIYFYISDVFFKALENRKIWALRIAHYFTIEVVGITLMYCSAAKRGIRFGRGNYHSWREHFIIAPLYSLCLSILGVIASSMQKSIYQILLLIFSIFFDLLLRWLGILKFNLKQCLGNIPIHIFMITIARISFKWIYDKRLK